MTHTTCRTHILHLNDACSIKSTYDVSVSCLSPFASRQNHSSMRCCHHPYVVVRHALTLVPQTDQVTSFVCHWLTYCGVLLNVPNVQHNKGKLQAEYRRRHASSTSTAASDEGKRHSSYSFRAPLVLFRRWNPWTELYVAGRSWPGARQVVSCP